MSTTVWHGKVTDFSVNGLELLIAGTKNVVKELHKICAGLVCTMDQTWFTELSDKSTSVLTGQMEYLAIQHEAPRCTCIGS